MELYIPPEGLSFRLQNYKSNLAIYSRRSPDPQFFHYTSGEYGDQYWTLIPGKGKHTGYFRIENCASKYAIYSRFSQDLQFFHYTSSDYDDQYWTFIPGTGKHSGYFRIENFVTKYAIYSRLSPDPQLFHYTSSDYDDQYWTFIFEDIVIESVDYKIDEGKIKNTASSELTRQTLSNDTDIEQTFGFKVDASETHTSSFEYSTGFTVKVGAEFKAGIPLIGETGISVDITNRHTWSFGNTTEAKKTYTADFPIKAPPRTKIIAVASIKKATFSVPYIMYLKSKKTGIKVDSYGTYSGITTWDLTYALTSEALK